MFVDNGKKAVKTELKEKSRSKTFNLKNNFVIHELCRWK